MGCGFSSGVSSTASLWAAAAVPAVRASGKSRPVVISTWSTWPRVWATAAAVSNRVGPSWRTTSAPSWWSCCSMAGCSAVVPPTRCTWLLSPSTRVISSATVSTSSFEGVSSSGALVVAANAVPVKASGYWSARASTTASAWPSLNCSALMARAVSILPSPDSRTTLPTSGSGSGSGEGSGDGVGLGVGTGEGVGVGPGVGDGSGTGTSSSALTVTVADAISPWNSADTVAVPSALPVTKPVSTVTTASSEEDQSASAVTSASESSSYAAVAINDAVLPTATPSSDGVTSTETGSGSGHTQSRALMNTSVLAGSHV